MQDWIKGLNPSVLGYAGVAAIAVGALIAFRIARRIVMLGYFLLYFFVGFAIVYAASAYAIRSPQVPLSMPIMGGLAFAVAANFVRAKLMRIVGAIMLVFLFSLAGKFWSQYSESQKPGGDKAMAAANQQSAMQGLSAVKSDFDDIVSYLPKKDGKIAAGWLSPDALRKAGIQSDFVKVDAKPAWHTWLTGLYNQDKEDLGIWTPGGTEEQAKKGLTVKPRD